MEELENQAIENNDIVEEPIAQDTLEEVKEELLEEESNSEESKEELSNNDIESEEDDDTPFPKKATRALERRNKKINKLRARIAELEAGTSKPINTEQNQIQPEPEGLIAPKEEDFDDYADYIRADERFQLEKDFAAKTEQVEQQRAFESQQKWVNERANSIDKEAAQLAETIPELDGLYKENQDIIEGYSDATKMAFLEAGNGSIKAFYALATEGKLEELDNMSPTRVAREIALAEIRGEKLTKTRSVSKAPAPIKRARGSGAKTKSLADMKPSELLEHLKKNKG